MTILYNYIRNCKLTLKKVFEKKHFRPDFTDKLFISSLSGSSLILQNAKKEYLNGNLKQSQQLIVEHFDTRSAPSFFLNVKDVDRLVKNIQNEHPAWRKKKGTDLFFR